MPRPNLLFLFTDEQRADTMRAYGNPVIDTPNLDRLAGESVLFERCYVTQPVCTPSRSSIVTGLMPHTNGCIGNNLPLAPEIACLPELLPRGEWATGYHGKWHLGDEAFAQHGFDDWVSVEGYQRHFAAFRDPNTVSSYDRYLVENGFRPKNGARFGRNEAAALPEEWGKPAFLAREASRFIRENRTRPFCLFVNFLEPHMPFTGPRDRQYDRAAVRLPANFNIPPDETQHLRAQVLSRNYYENGHGGHPLRTEQDWRDLTARYWGLCSLVDTHVGTILRALDDAGVADNTIVVYTSDHGDMMGSHRLLAKTVMFEEALRVPLLVRLPGRRGGRRVGGAISQIDLVPTLLDLMDASVPDALEGRSRRALLDGSGDRVDDDVIVEWNVKASGEDDGSPNVAEPPAWWAEYGTPEEIRAALKDEIRAVVIGDGWKMNWSKQGRHELYDLNADPGELRNRAVEPEMRGRMRAMADRIRRWQDRTGDGLVLPGL